MLHLTPELQAFRDEVRAFVRAQLPADISRKVLEGYPLAREDYVRWHHLLHAKGWGTPLWPQAYGGPGWSVMQRHLFDEECALAGAPELVPFGHRMAAPVLMKYGTPWQKDFFLPRMATLEHWWVQGYSEPGAGSDLAALRTRAQRVGEHYVVNGQKVWNTHGQYADWIFCLVRTSDEAKKQDGISFLLIDMHSPGVEVRPIITIDGAHEINEVWFTDAQVPVRHLVGEEGKGWSVAKYLLAHERANFGSTMGECQRELARVRRLAEAEGLLNDPLFMARYARLHAELHAIAATNLALLGSSDVHDTASPNASLLKVMASELQQDIAELAFIAGGQGSLVFDRATLAQGPAATLDRAGWCAPLAPTYLNMRKTSIYGGSNEIQKNIAAKLLLG